MQEWIIQVMNQFGYGGILFLIAIENLFPPIPSEVILTFGGFMTTYTNLAPFGVIFFSTIGSVLGAVALYSAGRFFSPQRIEGWLDGKLGKILHFEKGDVTKACDWFEKKGTGTVFFCRCVPILRSLISIPAGMAGMNIGLFLMMTICGSFIWNILLVYLGVFAGSSWEKIAGYIDTYSNLTLLVLVVVVAAAGFLFYTKKWKK